MDPLEGRTAGLVRLRPTTEEDLGFVLRTEGDEASRPFLCPRPRGWHVEALSDGDIEHLILECPDDGRPVGFAVLRGIEDSDRSIELRRLVISEKGRGHGRAALRGIKALAFGRLGAHRLWLDVKEHNLRARRLYESEGFVVEGTLRECLRNGDAYESLVVMSLLESEYRA